MCGINGYVHFGDAQAERLVNQMNTSLKHRGPDNQAVWQNEFVTLGHARLSIIDLSSNAHQPFISACGRYSIVFNGEIYNYKFLKEKLQVEKGIVFKTNSDTEVLLELFKQYGIKCLDELNGMFAFAIWDNLNHRLFAARDRLGEKPFYYSVRNGQLVFSSEVRALLSSNLIPKKIDRSALYNYILYQTVHAPQTLLEDVKQLMPGCYLIFDQKNGLQSNLYWKPGQSAFTGNKLEAIAEVRRSFERSIDLRMVADVEVGAFLSGGIDSSAVVAQMSRLSKKSISTFSVIFGESDFSEEEYSNLIAKKYNTNHYPIKIHPNEFLHQVPSILNAVDFPGGDGPNTYIVAQATRKTGIKVALSGLGGDELFAGYPVFKQAWSFKHKRVLRSSPLFMRKVVGKMAARVKKGTAGDKLNRILSQKELNDAVFYTLSRQLFDEAFAAGLLKENHGYSNAVKTISEPIFKSTTSHFLSSVSLAEISTYMQNVLLRDSDQMTMAHALEVRAPFLDHELVDLVLSIPDEFKYPNTPKQLFVEAMGELLPPEIVNRKKMGFVLPWAHWMRNELNLYCEQRINSLAKRNYFNEKKLIQLWDQFKQNHPSTPWSRIWHFVALEEWLAQNGINE